MTATLVVAGCSSGQRTAPSAGGNAEVGSASDINPQDPATLAQGGNLRLAIGAMPSNFNTLNLDGNEADTASVLRPTMPRAFVIASDGSMKVNTDYFTNVELTKTNPQVVTYTINATTFTPSTLAPSTVTPATVSTIATRVVEHLGREPSTPVVTVGISYVV